METIPNQLKQAIQIFTGQQIDWSQPRSIDYVRQFNVGLLIPAGRNPIDLRLYFTGRQIAESLDN